MKNINVDICICFGRVRVRKRRRKIIGSNGSKNGNFTCVCRGFYVEICVNLFEIIDIRCKIVDVRVFFYLRSTWGLERERGRNI